MPYYKSWYAQKDRESLEKQKQRDAVQQESKADTPEQPADIQEKDSVSEQKQDVKNNTSEQTVEKQSDTQEQNISKQAASDAKNTRSIQSEEKIKDTPVKISPSDLKKQAEKMNTSQVNSSLETIMDDESDDEDYDEEEDLQVDVSDNKPVKEKAAKVNVQYAPKEYRNENKAVVKQFPKSIVDYVKDQFDKPDQPTVPQAHYLAAYIYIAAGKPINLDVPDYVKDIAKLYRGHNVTIRDTREDILTRIDALKKIIKTDDDAIKAKVNNIELAVIYLLFCHFDWLKDEPASVNDVKFLEDGVDDLCNLLSIAAEKKRRDDAVHEGVPKRRKH